MRIRREEVGGSNRGRREEDCTRGRLGAHFALLLLIKACVHVARAILASLSRGPLDLVGGTCAWLFLFSFFALLQHCVCSILSSGTWIARAPAYRQPNTCAHVRASLPTYARIQIEIHYCAREYAKLRSYASVHECFTKTLSYILHWLVRKP
jgi:hypothetical protein